MSFCSFFSPFLTLMGDSGGGLSLASKLRSLSSENFVLLLSAIFNIVQVMYNSQVFFLDTVL